VNEEDPDFIFMVGWRRVETSDAHHQPALVRESL
jgi:hypothetical protein